MSEADYKNLKEEFKQFVYATSHDLNAYTRGMVEFAKLLRDEKNKESDDAKLYLEMIIDNGARLHQMMQGLAEYSHLDTIGKPLEIVDVNVIVQSCLKTLETKIKSQKAEIKAANLPKLKADAEQLMNLFLVILDNSLKYQPKDQLPQISIVVKDNSNEFLFSVIDNGIGINKDYADRVFLPFKRLHNYEEYPGIGLGLTIANKIVKRHNGKIWIEPGQMQGTKINFTITNN